jgi:predicted DCC family thiol-disulfide oxidoreductase YuxK
MSATLESATEPGQEPLTSAEHPLLLFFDGECNFCNKWVNRVRDADQAHRIRFGTKQGKTFQRVAKAHPEFVKIDSVVLVRRHPDGREDLLVRSAAVKAVIEGLSDFKLFELALKIFPTVISDIGYRIFSKLRMPLFGRMISCRVPNAEERKLFVD